MKYLKTFNESYKNSVAISDPEFNKLIEMIDNSLLILGIDSKYDRYVNERVPTKGDISNKKSSITITNPLNIKYLSLTFNFSLGNVPYSILDIIKKCIIKNDRVIFPTSKIYLDEITNKSIIFCNKDIRSTGDELCTINPPNIQEGYKIVMEKLLELCESFSTDFYDGISQYRSEITKNIIINYFKNILSNSPQDNVYQDLYTIVSNYESPFKLFTEIKENNNEVYNHLMKYTNNTKSASDMGEMGF